VEAAEVDQPALAERHVGRGVDDVIDLEDVVVPAVEQARDLAALELAVRHVQPAVQRGDHLLAEAPVDGALFLGELGQLVGGHDGRVRAPVADLPLGLRELLPGVQADRLPAHHHLPVPVVLGDRHHHLAGDVAPQDHRVGLVEGGRVEELPPADLGPMNVGGEEDSHQTTPRLPHAPGATAAHDAQLPRVLCNV
jgi:hypothetical protein